MSFVLYILSSTSMAITAYLYFSMLTLSYITTELGETNKEYMKELKNVESQIRIIVAEENKEKIKHFDTRLRNIEESCILTKELISEYSKDMNNLGQRMKIIEEKLILHDDRKELAAMIRENMKEVKELDRRTRDIDDKYIHLHMTTLMLKDNIKPTEHLDTRVRNIEENLIHTKELVAMHSVTTNEIKDLDRKLRSIEEKLHDNSKELVAMLKENMKEVKDLDQQIRDIDNKYLRLPETSLGLIKILEENTEEIEKFDTRIRNIEERCCYWYLNDEEFKGVFYYIKRTLTNLLNYRFWFGAGSKKITHQTDKH